jgi:hypothetical protein
MNIREGFDAVSDHCAVDALDLEIVVGCSEECLSEFVLLRG